jgi:hypothetical protein
MLQVIIGLMLLWIVFYSVLAVASLLYCILIVPFFVLIVYIPFYWIGVIFRMVVLRKTYDQATEYNRSQCSNDDDYNPFD